MQRSFASPLVGSAAARESAILTGQASLAFLLKSCPTAASYPKILMKHVRQFEGVVLNKFHRALPRL